MNVNARPRWRTRGRKAPAARRRTRVTLIPSESAGSDVTEAARRVLDAAGAVIEWERAIAGEEARRTGVHTGLPWETIESIRRTGLVLKGPLESGGFGPGAIDGRIRRSFEAFVHVVRIGTSPRLLWQGDSRGIGFVVLRNGYADSWTPKDGDALIEHGAEVRAEENAVKAAFDLAQREGRRRMCCAIVPGDPASEVRQRALDQLSGDYPDIRVERIHHLLLAQEMALRPEGLAVVLSGGIDDVLCELAVRLGGGRDVMASVRYGPRTTFFESGDCLATEDGPRRVANPTGVILAGVALLRHIGQSASARRVELALAAVLQGGSALEPGPGVRRVVTPARLVEEILEAVRFRSPTRF